MLNINTKRILLFIIFAVFLISAIYLFLANSGEVADEKPISMKEGEARKIAEDSCIKGGEALSAGNFNADSESWEFEANLNAVREGCVSNCIVSTATKTGTLEWQCDSVTPLVESSEIKCRPGDGGDFCTKEYKPVCGLVQVECVRAPCNPVRETFGNSCEACSNPRVSSYYEGICNDPMP